jgi:hypothetical protein
MALEGPCVTADIQKEEDATCGRFFASVAGGEAEITYVLRDDVMVIDRTFVPPAARGGDLAMRLVKLAVEEAKARGLKIDPQCSYVARVFDFMPEWSDLRA